jgi:pyridoxamine 5'-phosphate oxidase
MEIDRIYNSAIAKLLTHIKEAKILGLEDANCAVLATIGKDYQPSARIITIHELSHQGFLFVAHKQSGKIVQLEKNPRAGLCFYWAPLHIQANIEGIITTIDPATSAQLWNKREYNAQVAAWAQDIAAEEETDLSIEAASKQLRHQFEGRPPMADSWAGYCLTPTRIHIRRTLWNKPIEYFCCEKKGGHWHEHRS